VIHGSWNCCCRPAVLSHLINDLRDKNNDDMENASIKI